MGASTPGQTIEMLNRSKSQIFSVGHADRSVPSDPPDLSFPVVNKRQRIPEAGICFDMPAEHLPRVTKSLLDSIRCLHMNTGHPPDAELDRIVRLSAAQTLHASR